MQKPVHESGSSMEHTSPLPQGWEFAPREQRRSGRPVFAAVVAGFVAGFVAAAAVVAGSVAAAPVFRFSKGSKQRVVIGLERAVELN